MIYLGSTTVSRYLGNSPLIQSPASTSKRKDVDQMIFDTSKVPAKALPASELQDYFKLQVQKVGH